jgi:NADPH-dependent 2,4-dienoyl-CoA reductase/sulfur reductase-like enzyme
MIDAAQKYQHAVVIGGGLLGLEAAKPDAARHMTVSVVHAGPTLDGAPTDSVWPVPPSWKPASEVPDVAQTRNWSAR